MGSQRVWHNWVTNLSLSLSPCHWWPYQSRLLLVLFSSLPPIPSSVRSIKQAAACTGGPHCTALHFISLHRYWGLCVFFFFFYKLKVVATLQWALDSHHFSNSICSFCVSVPQFGNSHHISSFSVIIIVVMVISDFWCYYSGWMFRGRLAFFSALKYFFIKACTWFFLKDIMLLCT